MKTSEGSLLQGARPITDAFVRVRTESRVEPTVWAGAVGEHLIDRPANAIIQFRRKD